MPARTPHRRWMRRTAPLAWAAVSALAVMAFVVEIDAAPSPAPQQESTPVVPAVK